MFCLWSGTPRFNCWIFYSSIQLYKLLSPYLCFISFYLLGDNTSISHGSFMRTKPLFVLILIRSKGKVGAIKHV